MDHKRNHKIYKIQRQFIKKIKLTLSDTPEHNIQKTNLLCYNKILKKSMRLAKKLYFSSCFKKYKNDIKKHGQQ